ncbi:MAG TPA: ABC transporter ATP-binding protein [Clostridiales bacterium]|nr:ABC transporter ATP-binding protein [Clostridiales bacterium]
MKNRKILEINELSIKVNGDNEQTLVDKLSLSLDEGEILGLVGESGSGKTMTSLSILGLLPEDIKVVAGSIIYNGKDLLKEKEERLREIKGGEIAMIFQEPMTSLNPVLRLGYQVEEMLRLHKKMTKEEYKSKTIEALQEVGLKNPEEIYCKYPHQISGGMRQRVVIAMAMIAKPKILIADEPTTALDISTQNKILSLLKEINIKHKTSIILISHDLAVVKSICKNVLVLKDGVNIEEGDIKSVFINPKNDYTKSLVKSSVLFNKDIKKIYDKNINNIIEIKELTVFYNETNKSIFHNKKKVKVVDKVSFNIKEGEVFGIVGESGCGKSTLAKAIVGLNNNIEGEINLKGDMYTEEGYIVRPQMVFQDPYSSLNPSKKVRWIIEESVRNKTKIKKTEREDLVRKTIKLVGLEEKYLSRYISQLSGGQRQRVAIATALILNPKLIILDEAVSSLDSTIQMQILELLKKLKEDLGLSYLFISHDLNVIKTICDRVAVMLNGKIREINNVKDIFENPQDEYTKKLLKTTEIHH